jgi:hypothetical protein
MRGLFPFSAPNAPLGRYVIASSGFGGTASDAGRNGSKISGDVDVPKMSTYLEHISFASKRRDSQRFVNERV